MAMLTPRAKKRQAIAAAYAQAKAVSCNLDMAAKVFDETLAKEGWKIIRIPHYELRQRAAEELRSVEVAGAPQRN